MYLSSCLFRFNAKKPMAIFRRSINVTKCATVRHVLGYKTDLVNRVMIQTILENKKKYILFGFITTKPSKWQLMQNGGFFPSDLRFWYVTYLDSLVSEKWCKFRREMKLVSTPNKNIDLTQEDNCEKIFYFHEVSEKIWLSPRSIQI